MKWFASDKKVYPIVVVTLALLIIVAAYGPAAAGEPRHQPEAQEGLSNGILLPLLAHDYKHVWQDSVFGVQVYGSTTDSNRFTPYLLESGASWVRVPILWEHVEPSNVAPAQYDWAAVDSALAVAKKSGGPKVIATIDNNPSWIASHGGSPIWDGMENEFVQFVTALVERFDGDGIDDAPGSPVVLHWEFYNEPDAQTDHADAGWGDFPERYAAMLKLAHGAVKGANPNAYVIFGGIAFDWYTDEGGPFIRNFLDNVLQHGAGPYFDMMNFHTYPAFSLNWAPHGPGLYQKAQAVRAKLAEHGLNKPIIVTEAGWYSDTGTPHNPSSPEIQARYVTILFTQSLAADLDLMIWWMLFDPGGHGLDYGLVTEANPPAYKPSFHAYSTIVDKLGNATFQGVVPTGVAAAEAYRFRDDLTDETIYVAWLNPVNTGGNFTLRVPGAQATVSNIYGNGNVVRDADDGAADGQISVQVGAQPVYVEVSQ
jgi:hypothetical protein